MILEEYKWLPVGENRRFVSALWETAIVEFDSTLINYSEINKALPKYSKLEINQSIKEFKQSNHASANKENIAAKLFISSLSNKEKAEKYFYAFQTKFHPLDGAIAEDYSELMSMYHLWNNCKNECETRNEKNEAITRCYKSWGTGGGDVGSGPTDIESSITIKNLTGINIYEFFEKDIS